MEERPEDTLDFRISGFGESVKLGNSFFLDLDVLVSLQDN